MYIPVASRYRPKQFCLWTFFTPVRLSMVYKLCISSLIFEHRKFPETRFTSTISDSYKNLYEGIYLVFIRLLCIFVDILTVCYTFIYLI